MNARAAFSRLHAALYRRSGGRLGGSVGGQPVLIVHTRGRRSGAARATPVQYLAADGGWLVVAAAGGAPHPPAWSFNLAAAPDAEIELRGERIAVRARTLAGRSASGAGHSSSPPTRWWPRRRRRPAASSI